MTVRLWRKGNPPTVSGNISNHYGKQSGDSSEN